MVHIDRFTSSVSKITSNWPIYYSLTSSSEYKKRILISNCEDV